MKKFKKIYVNFIFSILLIIFSIRRILIYKSNPSNYNEVAMFLIITMGISYILCSFVIWKKLERRQVN